MTIDRVVVVGSSVAGIRAAQALRGGSFDGELIVVGAESADPYDKPPLSKQFLTGESTEADIGLLRADGEFDLHLGTRAIGLDAARKEVVVADGQRVGYDALIIATGVRARTPPGWDKKLVRPLRELWDAAALRERLAGRTPVVIIGGGFIGAEVAAAAVTAGCQVTIVEALPAPFFRVLGPDVGSLLIAMHAEHGVSVLTGATVVSVNALPGDEALVRLSDGRTLEAGTVVAGVGCMPNTEWLAGSGLPVEDGVLTDERCAVRGVEGVYAIGDVARWYDRAGRVTRRVEHWTNAVEQANLVAHQILRPEVPRHHASVPYFWSDQYGVKIQMVGRVAPGDTAEVLCFATPAGDRNVALYSRTGQCTAAVTFGWPRGSLTARQAWQRGATAEDLLAALTRLSDGVTPVGLAAQKGKLTNVYGV
jgi:NADPH-dependent 2,4-dienoyl-CoA reductase/sulfur reductase-like enzyme